MSTRLIKSRPQSGASFVLCVHNSKYPASLELHKIYRVIADRGALESGDLRVVDEGGEDYLYPADWFIPIDGDGAHPYRATGGAVGRPTAPTTVLDGLRASGNTQGLAKPKTRRRGVVAAAVALAAAAYFYAARTASTEAKNSIAVMPFENASNDPNMEYLSDGISESLINSLSQLPKVRVLARSTMFRFKGQDADPQQVGKQLGVDAVLTGRVVQVGDSLNV